MRIVDMKRKCYLFQWIFLVLFLSLTGVAGLQAQSVNGTQQLPNRGFEDYDNLGKENVEPVGWNSFMTANSAGGLIDLGKAKRLDRSDERRPGSPGLYSMRVFAKSVAGVNANGNVTTGRINMGSTTPDSPSNYNYTDRGASGFNMPFTVVPDSMIIWARYSKPGEEGQIRAVIHNDANGRDPGTDMNGAVAIATINPTAGSGGWIRYSAPFKRDNCNSNDPRYILVSITTNKKPGGAVAELWVDDILFYYVPTLVMGEIGKLTYDIRYSAAEVSIPFTITGTMERNTEQKNKIIAELSDARGSFEKATVIGQVETAESGVLKAYIPQNTPLGTGYRIRLRSTETPITTADNGKDISVIQAFVIEANADPVQGSVTGAGPYASGETATLQAVPAVGYHFVEWKENGARVEGAGSTYSFTVNGDRTLEAVFAINEYELVLTKVGEGSLEPEEGSYTYRHNDRISIKAIPAGMFEFGGFYVDGVMVSKNPVYEFNITRNTNLEARFVQGKLSVDLAVNDPSLGSVSGGGLYESGSQVTLKAEPAPFCDFVAWLSGKDTLSKEKNYTFIIDSDRLITAVFAARQYSVTLMSQPSGAGSLKGGGRYSALQGNNTILIEAIPNPGYRFLYWENVKTGKQYEDNPYKVIDNSRLLENLDFTAYFEAMKFDVALSAQPAEGGSVRGGGSFAYGQTTFLEAEPALGYRFAGWVKGEDTLSKDLSFQYKVQESVSVKAVFVKTRHQLAVTVKENGYGEVSGAGEYDYADTASLLATAYPGYEFRYWAEKDGLELDTVSKENPLKIEVTSHRELMAVFSFLRKGIEAVCLPLAGGHVLGTGLYEHGSYAQLEAVSNPGYSFSAWLDKDGQRMSVNPKQRVQMLRDTVVRAEFTPDPHTVVVMTEGMSGVGSVRFGDAGFSVTQSVETEYDALLAIEARAEDPTYRFMEWRLRYEENGKQVDSFYSREMTETYMVRGDVTLVACFAQDMVNISAEVQPSGSGKVLNQGNYVAGKWVELKAEPSRGYQFAGWMDKEGNLLSEGKKSLQIRLLEDTVVYAGFEVAEYGISLQAWPSLEGNQVSGSAVYKHGDPVKIEAVAAHGYRFEGWYASGDEDFAHRISDQSIYEFQADTVLDLIARFVPLSMEVNVRIYPENTGLVSGGGSYAFGSEYRLLAEAEDGYEFSGWILNQGGVPSDTVQGTMLRSVVDGSVDITAWFSPIHLLANVAALQPDRGEVVLSGSSAFRFGDTLKAEARIKDPHYRFEQWVDNRGVRISREKNLEICLSRDTLVYASFKPAEMLLEVVSEDESKGYVMPYENRPEYASVVSLEAVPATGYGFAGWKGKNSDSIISISPVLRCEIFTDSSLVATFEKINYQIRLIPSVKDAGVVTISRVENEDTIGYGDFILATAGENLLLEAHAGRHYTFDSWVNGGLTLSEDSLWNYAVAGNAALTARFEPRMYQVQASVSSEFHGSVKGGGYFPYGDTVSLLAEPLPGYTLQAWMCGEEILSKEPELKVFATGDTSVLAVFAPDSVQVQASALLGGTVTGQGRVLRGENITLTAVPGQAYRFRQWTTLEGKTVSDQNPYQFTVVEPISLLAEFESLDIQVEALAGEGGSVTGSGNYSFGTVVSLIASADEGYVFGKWVVEEGVLEGRDLESSLLTFAVKGKLRIRAEFEPGKCQVETLCSPLEGGSVTPGGVFSLGGNMQFDAHPAANYDFVGWTRNGEWISEDPVLKTVADGDATYVAVYLPKKYKILTASYPSTGALTYGSGSYYWGDTATISVVPYAGYTVNSWVDIDFATVSKESSFRRVVNRIDMYTVNLDGSGTNNSLEEKAAGEESLVVYPNPVGDQGLVHFLMEKNVITRVGLYNLNGVRVLEKTYLQTGTDKVQLSVSELPKGCYIYQVQTTGGSVLRGKLIRL